MVSKTWTAEDIELGKLTVIREGDNLTIERRYKFLDGEGKVLAQIAGGRVRETVAIVDIPPDILAALQEIDAWTKVQALEQEEMT